MNNGEYEFDKYLREMENEVVNLKTAHQRPLGALDFFKKSVDFNLNLPYQYGSYSATINVIVKITTPTAKPPIVQTGWNIPPNFFSVDFMDFSVSNDYETWTYQLYLSNQSVSSVNFKVSSISSQPIESITWSYV